MQLRSEFLGYLYPDRLDRKEGGVLFDDGSVVVPGNLFVGENISALSGMLFRSITLKCLGLMCILRTTHHILKALIIVNS